MIHATIVCHQSFMATHSSRVIGNKHNKLRCAHNSVSADTRLTKPSRRTTITKHHQSSQDHACYYILPEASAAMSHDFSQLDLSSLPSPDNFSETTSAAIAALKKSLGPATQGLSADEKKAQYASKLKNALISCAGACGLEEEPWKLAIPIAGKVIERYDLVEHNFTLPSYVNKGNSIFSNTVQSAEAQWNANTDHERECHETKYQDLGNRAPQFVEGTTFKQVEPLLSSMMRFCIHLHLCNKEKTREEIYDMALKYIDEEKPQPGDTRKNVKPSKRNTLKGIITRVLEEMKVKHYTTSLCALPLETSAGAGNKIQIAKDDNEKAQDIIANFLDAVGHKWNKKEHQLDMAPALKAYITSLSDDHPNKEKLEMFNNIVSHKTPQYMERAKALEQKKQKQIEKEDKKKQQKEKKEREQQEKKQKLIAKQALVLEKLAKKSKSTASVPPPATCPAAVGNETRSTRATEGKKRADEGGDYEVMVKKYISDTLPRLDHRGHKLLLSIDDENEDGDKKPKKIYTAIENNQVDITYTQGGKTHTKKMKKAYNCITQIMNKLDEELPSSTQALYDHLTNEFAKWERVTPSPPKESHIKHTPFTPEGLLTVAAMLMNVSEVVEFTDEGQWKIATNCVYCQECIFFQNNFHKDISQLVSTFVSYASVKSFNLYVCSFGLLVLDDSRTWGGVTQKEMMSKMASILSKRAEISQDASKCIKELAATLNATDMVDPSMADDSFDAFDTDIQCPIPISQGRKRTKAAAEE